MNGRQRFLETMCSGHPDRVPYFEDGIHKDVLKVWRKQELWAGADLTEMFTTSAREEIDLDVLNGDKEAIRREVEEKVPPLLAQGGYVPLVDGRVRGDVPWDNYLYYRQLLVKITS